MIFEAAGLDSLAYEEHRSFILILTAYYLLFCIVGFTVLKPNLQMDTSPAKERGRIRNVQKHFVINTALLSMIDPVRGGPTKESFESFTVNDDILQTYQLKQKFLDSFALICSTSSSGKETASAVCLEQNQPRHTILRVARNHGLSQRDHDGLERILQILVVAASEGNVILPCWLPC